MNSKRKLFTCYSDDLDVIQEYFDTEIAPFIDEIGDNLISVSEYTTAAQPNPMGEMVPDAKTIFVVFYRHHR